MNLRQVGSTLAIFVVTWAIFVASPIHPLTDSRYSTLASEALIRSGSLSLDPWFSARKELPYQVEAAAGHVYSWYPPGGPVLAAPFIGAMAAIGLSVVAPDGSYDERGDVIVQAGLAGFFMAVLSVVLLKVSREILPSPASWIVGLGGALGTQIWSTASRVLWGDTVFTLLVGAVVWTLVLHEKGTRKISAPLLATLLAWAYFCRPTASITVLAVTIYVGLNAPDRFVRFALTGISWFALFLAWSWHTFGTLLPGYYRIHSFGFDHLGTGLLGILFSASRGQFVFVPVTLFVAYLVVRYRQSLPLSRLLTPALIAILGHVVLIGAFPQWQGGHSYGPRYLTPLVHGSSCWQPWDFEHYSIGGHQGHRWSSPRGLSFLRAAWRCRRAARVSEKPGPGT